MTKTHSNQTTWTRMEFDNPEILTSHHLKEGQGQKNLVSHQRHSHSQKKTKLIRGAQHRSHVVALFQRSFNRQKIQYNIALKRHAKNYRINRV